MDTFTFFVIVFSILLLNLLIGFFKARGTNLIIYTSDPDKYSYIFISLSISGTVIGGGMFLAVSKIGYESGTAGYILGIIYLVGLSLMGLLGTKIRSILNENGVNNLLDIITIRFSERVTKQFSIINFFIYLFLLAGQFVALFQFSKYFLTTSINPLIIYILVIFSIIIIILYPLIGGLRKDIQTDILQVFIILVASFFILFRLFNLNIVDTIYLKLPEDRILGIGYGYSFIIGAVLFLTPSFLVRMDMWQRIRASKSDKDTLKGFILASIITCFFYFFFSTLGMWALVSKLPDSEYATFQLLNYNFNNPIILSIIFGAFFAAILSSADTFLNNSSLFITKLIYPSLWDNTQEENNKILTITRIFALVIFILSLLLGYYIPDIVNLFVGAFSLILIFLPIIIGTIVENVASERAAFYSPLIGVAVFVPLFFLIPKTAFVPSVFVSFIAYYFIYKLDRNRNT